MNFKNSILSSIITIGLVIIGAFFGSFWFSGDEQTSDTSKCLAPEIAVVTKVLDGDTIIVEGGNHVRLLGIDADESGDDCYMEAKSFLEDLILDEEVRLEQDVSDVDMYNRCLRYVFEDGKNINVQIIESGMATARFYQPDIRYREEIIMAEQTAKNNQAGCEWKSLSDK